MSDGTIFVGEMIGWGCLLLIGGCALFFGAGLFTGWMIWG